MNTVEKKHAPLRRGRTYFRPVASSGFRLRPVIGTVVMTLLGVAGAFAYGQIHRQIDSATGITTYIYQPSPRHRGDKESPVSHSAPDKRPSRAATPTKQQVSMKPRPESRITSSVYKDFPQVSAETQKARDQERRRILKHELAWEQAALNLAIENKDAGDVLRRHRENIESLHREIRNVQ